MQAVGEVAVRRGALKLGQLAADVQALRDVKHFVKDYKGHMLPADHTMGKHDQLFMLPINSSTAGKRVTSVSVIVNPMNSMNIIQNTVMLIIV